MAAYTRKQYSGAARNTTTTTLLTNVGTTVDIAATTGWPSVADVPFYVVIEPASINEEKCLATISGSTLTLTRAQDDTTASEHPIGSVIYPVFTANDADEANELVSKLTTKGDLLATTGNSLERLPVGANGTFLKANSSASVGAEWSGITLGTDTSGNYVSDFTQGTGVTITHTPGEGSNATIAIGQAVGTSSSVTFAHVAADVTGDLTGNADTASALQTARVIELSGDVSGSASFDGTSSINISTTVNTSSVAIGELNGVNITSPEEFQTLEYNGTEWVNAYAPVVSYVRNVESTTITTGTAVYLYGGTGDHASVKRADNSSDTTSSKTVGLAGANIAAAQNGPVITRGYVNGLDLSAYNPGDVLWLGKNGQLTTTKPSAPDHLVFIGVVVRATNNGIVYVATQNGYELDELHNVKIDGLTDGQFLRYNSASTMWVNDTVNLGTDTAGDYVQSLVAGTGITLSNNSGESATPTIAIGQSVATSASVTFAHLIVQGDMEVQGTITRLNETNLDVDTAFIYLNANSASANPDMGVAFNYNDGTYKHAGIFRDSSDGIFKIFDSYEPEPVSPIDTAHGTYNDAAFQANNLVLTQGNGIAPLSVSSSTVVTNLNADYLDGQHGSYYAPIDSPTFTGTVSLPNNTVALGTQTTGNYVADVSGGTGVTVTHTPGEGTTPSVAIGQDVATSASVTFAQVTAPVVGNASTASELQTTRTISISGDVTGSVSFNGSSNVDISATIQPNSVALGTDTTGNYVSDVTAGTGVTVSHTPGEGSSPTVSIGQAVATSSSVTFAAVTAPVIGNASTATTLETSRTIELTGDVTGSVSFNGSSNAVMSTTIASNSVALGSDTTGDYVASLVAGTGVSLANNSGESATPTISIGQAVSTSSSVSFAHVNAPVTGNLNGNAETASRLQTTRTIQISGDVSGSVVFDGSNNVNIATVVEPNSVALGTDTTGDYVSSLVAGTGVTVTNNSGESATPTVAIGQAVATSSSVTFAQVTTTDKVDVGTNLTVGGQYVRLNESQSASPLLSASIAIERGTQPNVSIRWNEETDVWEFTNDGSTFEEIGSGGGLLVSATAPANPEEGDLWFDSTSFDTFVYYGTTWVQQNTPPSEISDLEDLMDVSVFGAETGDLLKYDGTEWIASPIASSASTAIALQTPRTISLSGDVSGSVSFDGSSNVTISTSVQPNSIALGTDTTGNYMSDLTAGSGVTITHTPGEGSNATIAIGQEVGTSASVTFAKVTTTGDVVIGGDLTVNGTTTTINTETLAVEDNIIVLNSNASGAPSVNAGVEIERGSSTNVVLRWNESTDKWEVTEDGSSYKTIAVGQNVETSSSVTFAAVTAPLVGNASTASTLETARTISLGGDLSGSVSFNGSSDVTISATVQPNSVALGTDTTGNYMSDLSAGTGISISHTPGEGSTATITNTGVTSVNGSSGAITGVVRTSDTGTVTSTMLADGTVMNIDINASAGIAHSKLADASPGQVLLGTTTTGVITATALSGDVTITGGGVTSIGSGVIVNADISAAAAISHSKLASLTSGNILVGNGSNVPTAVAVTGDVTISNAGVTAIGAGVIVNADINSSAAIAHSKLANATAGQVLLGTTTTGVVTATTVSGDVTINGAGVTAIGSGVIVDADINASAAIDKTKISGTAITAADTGTVTSTMIADGTIVDADINASAAIALSKLASGTSGQIIVANASGVPAWVSESGDISIDANGVTAIASGVIVDADISSSAAIDASKITNWENDQIILSGQIFG